MYTCISVQAWTHKGFGLQNLMVGELSPSPSDGWGAEPKPGLGLPTIRSWSPKGKKCKKDKRKSLICCKTQGFW